MSTNEQTINMKQIMMNQPVVNIGMTGHVANGKSTLTMKLTKVATQKYSSEKERNITIRLGYANTKIWKCKSCTNPEAYTSSGSDVMENYCEHCELELELVNHISIVDCPGHNMLTSTMLNGSSVMDYTVLVESFTNKDIPAPQTIEHLTATRAAGIETGMIVMNKLDIIKNEDAEKKIGAISEYISEKFQENVPPMVPISATFNINIDVICEYMAQLKIPESRDRNGIFKMIVIRSFDINKPGTDVTKLNGGVIGGTIMRGTLNEGDRINIYPGIYIRIPESEKTQDGPDFKYSPLSGEVITMHSDKNCINTAIPGGLLGIQTSLDPSFTRNDLLTGSLVLKSNDVNDPNLKDLYKVYDKIIVEMSTFIINEENIADYLKKETIININVNSNNVDCKIVKYSKKTKELRLYLMKPIVIDKINNFATIMSKENGNVILGRGIIVDGIECMSN